MDFISYPRTSHIEGSGLQKGDDRASNMPMSQLRSGFWVAEEKVDGANSGISFSDGYELTLQSRGAVLSRSKDVWRERHFNHLKTWADVNEGELLNRLEDRYVLFGEWMGAAHSVFYDHLPHLMLEFDVWDRKGEFFLSTLARRELLRGLDISSVPVLYSGSIDGPEHLRSLVKPSLFRTDDWEESLARSCAMVGDDYAVRRARMFDGGTSEGLYFKLEDGDRTIARAKWVEPGFVQIILDSDVHWQSTFVVPNFLGRSLPEFPPNLVRQNAVGGDYDPDKPDEWAALMQPLGLTP